MEINPLGSGFGATPSPSPNYPQLAKDYEQLVQELADFTINLQAYLKDPHGKNALEEINQMQSDMGRMLTLFNPSIPGNFFSAANGNSQVIGLVSEIQGILESMRATLNSSDYQGTLDILTKSPLFTAMTNLFAIITA